MKNNELNEQEGFSHSPSPRDGQALTCSSYFCARAFSLADFRGRVVPEGEFVPAHKNCTFVEWETSEVESKQRTIFTWIGGSQMRPVGIAFPPVLATLLVDGIARLQFPIGLPGDWSVGEEGFVLCFEPRRFLSLVESSHRTLDPHGVSGFYRLEVSSEYLTPGEPLRLRVELPSPPEDIETFFYVSPRTDALRVDLALLRDELTQLQADVVQLKRSHEMLYTQVYPHLFPARVPGELVIAHQEETLHLHPPQVTVLRDGEIVLTMREATDHLALDGRIIAVRSRDNGKTWSEKEVLFDLGNSDHRSSPIFELENGDWLTTDYRAGGEYSPEGVWDVETAIHAPTLWGAWSSDKGKTWSFTDEPMVVPGAYHPYVEAERHMIQLPSGRLLVAANYVEAKPDGSPPDFKTYRIAIFSSDDSGRSWQVFSHLPRHPATVGEATILQTQSGKIILLSRTSAGGLWLEGFHDLQHRIKGDLLQSVSHDDGKSWSEWQHTGMSSMSSPAHLLQLQDGRILCTHAARAYPGSIYVTTSKDGGETWDNASTRVVTNDIPSDDSCYPTSGQMQDGTIITTWYANLFGKFFVPVLRYRPEQI